MKVYKLQGKAKCVFCDEGADLYIDGIHIAVCRKCGVGLYKNLGEHFVPKAVPNVILRSEKQYKPLSMVYEENDKNITGDKQEETQIAEKKKEKSTHEKLEKFKRKIRQIIFKSKVKGETNERNSK